MLSAGELEGHAPQLICSLLGSARVSRAGFGVSPKQSFFGSPRRRNAFASTRDARATRQPALPRRNAPLG
ncbi:MAG: hypothetical protein DMF19_01155 [Verrucomicrobia bacterium]|nr:MAG: hypothetical protein DMF19_01155 [Verrucomicrobiota bacterium]